MHDDIHVYSPEMQKQLALFNNPKFDFYSPTQTASSPKKSRSMPRLVTQNENLGTFDSTKLKNKYMYFWSYLIMN